jgi:Tfp pilus assembly protein PilX
VAALLSIFVLTAAGILAFTMTTQDARISTRTVGEVKAFSAAEAGIHALAQKYDPGNPATLPADSQQVDPNNDPDSRYTIAQPTIPTRGPAAIPYQGFAIGGTETWGQTRHLSRVTGSNTRYNSNIQVEAGIGFGPVDITTLYR